jgi:hypothetical protein
MKNTRPTRKAPTASVDSKPGSFIGLVRGVVVVGTGSVVTIVMVVGFPVFMVVRVGDAGVV